MAGLPGLQSRLDFRGRLAAAQNAKLNRDGVVGLLASAFDQVRAEIHDDRLVSTAAIDGMLRALDLHSRFIEQEQLTSPTGQLIGGVGLNVRNDAGNVRVVSPIEGSPAEKAGIIAGDIIKEIDGMLVGSLPLEQTVARLRGPVGSTVLLEVERAGRRQPIHVAMTRAIIRVTTVTSRAESDVGYIRITSFNEQTTARLRAAIKTLQAQIPDAQLKGFVVDLRDNSGGLLTQTVSITSTFLAGGAIGTTRRRNNVDERFVAQGSDATNGKPIAVLVNGSTAAGAEIVAGALQYHHRATIVGTRSNGAGTIQTIFPLGGERGALRMTTARFYTPADQKLDAIGIEPDLVVVQPTARPGDASEDVQLRNALSLLRQPKR